MPRLEDGLAARVIQRIFSAGMLLNGAADGLTPETSAAVQRAVGELNAALRDISGASFLTHAGDAQAGKPDALATDLQAAAECLAVVATTITNHAFVQAVGGACSVDLVEAAYSSLRARIAVEEAFSAQAGLGPQHPDGFR